MDNYPKTWNNTYNTTKYGVCAYPPFQIECQKLRESKITNNFAKTKFIRDKYEKSTEPGNKSAWSKYQQWVCENHPESKILGAPCTESSKVRDLSISDRKAPSSKPMQQVFDFPGSDRKRQNTDRIDAILSGNTSSAGKETKTKKPKSDCNLQYKTESECKESPYCEWVNRKTGKGFCRPMSEITKKARELKKEKELPILSGRQTGKEDLVRETETKTKPKTARSDCNLQYKTESECKESPYCEWVNRKTGKGFCRPVSEITMKARETKRLKMTSRSRQKQSSDSDTNSSVNEGYDIDSLIFNEPSQKVKKPKTDSDMTVEDLDKLLLGSTTALQKTQDSDFTPQELEFMEESINGDVDNRSTSTMDNFTRDQSGRIQQLENTQNRDMKLEDTGVSSSQQYIDSDDSDNYSESNYVSSIPSDYFKRKEVSSDQNSQDSESDSASEEELDKRLSQVNESVNNPGGQLSDTYESESSDEDILPKSEYKPRNIVTSAATDF